MAISGDALRAIGARLREAREAPPKQSQQQVARAAGISRTYLVEIEQGRANITLDTLFTLAECLSVDPAEIVRQA